MRYTTVFAAASCLLPLSAFAQQPQAQSPPQQPAEWSKLPRMQLERQFAGPLQDTLIQRWRDPVDGTICYLYLPILAPHSGPTASGYVQYGATTIGAISCTVAPGVAVPPARPSATRPSSAPTPAPPPVPPATPQR
jgi:hypothetical protein